VRGDLARPRASARRQWSRLVLDDARRRLSGLARGAARLAFAAYVGLLAVLTLPALWGLVIALPGGPMVDAVVRRWCRTMLALTGCRVRTEGLDRLPASGGAVFTANHSSYLDAVVLLAWFPATFRFVAKRELLAAPLIGAVIRKVGHLTVERVDLSRSVADAERVSSALRGGTSLFVFPEGTFVGAPGLLPFKLGAFKAAVDAQCPVVPVSIRGTREILPADTWLPRPGMVTITVGTPLHPRGQQWREIVRLRDESRAAIARHTSDAPPAAAAA
jgi:1-acyl-sn-glycerol-3-phosphate acyltransferase